MKNAVLLSALAVSIVIGGTVQGMAASHSGKAKHSFESLDINSDGQVTQDEFTAHREGRFNRADTNGDGVLNRAEMLARGAARAERVVDRMLDRKDANGDGALSLAEMQEGRGGDMFQRADTDGDGAVSRDEYQAMQDRHAARRDHAHKPKE